MIEESLYAKYLDALLAGNRKECHHIVQELLEAKVDIKDLYTGLFQRGMYEVGELWERNTITVAREHLATAITESLLNLAYPSVFSVERVGKKAIISCVANEFHQVGGKIVADTFELSGWDGIFLGANTPEEDLMQHIQEENPVFIGLSLSILSNIENLKSVIERIQADFPDIDLLVGGQAFRWGGVDMVESYANTAYVPSLGELERIIKAG